MQAETSRKCTLNGLDTGAVRGAEHKDPRDWTADPPALDKDH